MLSPSEVLPFLTHDREFVQDLAIDYLKDAADPSPVTADDLWQAIDRLGAKRNRRRLLLMLPGMPQTDSSYQCTIAALGDSAVSTDDRKILLRVIQSLDVPLVRRHRDELLGNQRLDETMHSHLRRLLELADHPPDALWEQLLQYVRQFDQNLEEKRPNEQELDRFILAIGQSPGDAPARAVDVLKNSRTNWSWARVPALMLLTKVPHEPAVATVIDQLDLDEDWVWENGPKIIARNGNASVAQIEAAFPQSPQGSRISMGSALGSIKTPQSEAALHRLLLAEPDTEAAHMLAGALCFLIPPPAMLADIRDLQLAGRLDTGYPMYDIPEMIMAAGAMVGYEPPEAKQWLEKMVRDRKRIARLTSGIGRPSEVFTSTATAARLPPPPMADEVVMPIRRTDQKVGRNDPCPCGSAKKYKKCCGA